MPELAFFFSFFVLISGWLCALSFTHQYSSISKRLPVVGYQHCPSRISSLCLFAVRDNIKASGDSSCKTCSGKSAVNCTSCKGTGIDKVNGNVFERWTCNKCKGFGYIPCTACSGSTGLTPEQRGER